MYRSTTLQPVTPGLRSPTPGIKSRIAQMRPQRAAVSSTGPEHNILQATSPGGWPRSTDRRRRLGTSSAAVWPLITQTSLAAVVWPSTGGVRSGALGRPTLQPRGLGKRVSTWPTMTGMVLSTGMSSSACTDCMRHLGRWRGSSQPSRRATPTRQGCLQPSASPPLTPRRPPARAAHASRRSSGPGFSRTSCSGTGCQAASVCARRPL
mmetsp:Transcript_5772/g.15982  ORF Transcript_5772/g.15982 Transcript_5772/m.15982 type:complete len:208 (+) Transcript_5772:30-653(+)